MFFSPPQESNITKFPLITLFFVVVSSFHLNVVNTYKKSAKSQFHDFYYPSPEEKIVLILRKSIRCKYIVYHGTQDGATLQSRALQAPCPKHQHSAAGVPQHTSVPAVASGTQIWTTFSLLFLTLECCYRAEIIPLFFLPHFIPLICHSLKFWNRKRHGVEMDHNDHLVPTPTAMDRATSH